MSTSATPSPLAPQTSAHLARLSGELGAEAVHLNTKGEATFSLEHLGHRLELALAVAEDVGVVVLRSYVGTVMSEERRVELAVLLGALNLSVADTGGTAMAMLPGDGRIYAVYSLIGEVSYESFRAAFARVVEVTSAWRSRIARDVVLAEVLRV